MCENVKSQCKEFTGNKNIYWPAYFNSKTKPVYGFIWCICNPIQLSKNNRTTSWEDSFLLSYRERLRQCDISKARDHAENKAQWVTVYFQSVLMRSQASLTMRKTLHGKQKSCLPNLKNYTITGISWRKWKRHIWIQWGLVFVCRIKCPIEKLNRAHLFIKCPLLKCILSNF